MYVCLLTVNLFVPNFVTLCTFLCSREFVTFLFLYINVHIYVREMHFYMYFNVYFPFIFCVCLFVCLLLIYLCLMLLRGVHFFAAGNLLFISLH